MEDAVPRHHADSSTVLFEDGLGRRVRHADPHTGVERHALVLRSAFAAVPSFEFELREQVERLAAFQHPQVARVVAVDRLPGDAPELRVSYEPVAGARLSDLLRGAQARQVPVGINAALCVVRQLVPALAALQDAAPSLAHGAFAPERLLVTPDARVIVTDHVLARALEQLRYSRERYWSELKVALPTSATPCPDQRADVLQLGLTALAVILGRLVRLEEFPSRIPDVLASTAATSPQGGFEPLPAGIRGWLARALQIGPERPFATAAEARDVFDRVLGNAELVASPATLAAFLARYQAAESPVASTDDGAERRAAVVVPRSLPALPSSAPPLQLVASQRVQDVADGADILALAAPVAAESLSASVRPRSKRPPTTEQRAVEYPSDAWTAHLDPDTGGRRWWWNWRLVGAFALLAGIVGASGSLGAARQLLQLVEAARGTLELTSMPAGAEVFVDGESRGTTPLVLSLASGAHEVELRAGKARRAFGVIIEKGEKVTQQVKLPKSAPPRTVRPASKSGSGSSAHAPAAQPASEASIGVASVVGVDRPVDTVGRTVSALPPLPAISGQAH